MHTHMGGCTYQGVIDSTTLSTRFTSCTSIHTICVDRCTLWTILPSTLLKDLMVDLNYSSLDKSN